MTNRDEILQAVARMASHVFRRGDRRAPHKPLLVLLALARLRNEGVARIPFREIEQKLRPLLDAFAPPVKGSHSPQLPYWHLQSDGLWQVEGAGALDRQRGGFPRLDALRETTGGFPPSIASALASDPLLCDAVIRRILADHFPESLHDDILESVGLSLSPDVSPDAPLRASDSEPPASRDPAFRSAVLRAYAHRCALTGFHAQLRGAHLGVEAAHVHWHSHGGPDTVANGVALQSTMHKLFDAGAWSLTDDRRVIVSQDVTGSDETTAQLRGHHGKSLGAPLSGFPPLSVEFIRWHREPERGGVFREPALPL